MVPGSASARPVLSATGQVSRILVGLGFSSLSRSRCIVSRKNVERGNRGGGRSLGKLVRGVAVVLTVEHIYRLLHEYEPLPSLPPSSTTFHLICTLPGLRSYFVVLDLCCALSNRQILFLISLFFTSRRSRQLPFLLLAQPKFFLFPFRSL